MNERNKIDYELGSQGLASGFLGKKRTNKGSPVGLKELLMSEYETNQFFEYVEREIDFLRKWNIYLSISCLYLSYFVIVLLILS